MTSDSDFSKFILVIKVENGLKGSKRKDKKTDQGSSLLYLVKRVETKVERIGRNRSKHFQNTLVVDYKV